MPDALRPIVLRALVVVLLAAVAIGCGRKREPTGFLTAPELYRIAERRLASRDLRKARTMLERIQYAAEDRQELEPLVRLMLADIAFYQGNTISLIEARSMYLDFVTLYGDHPRAPYAQMQAGVCSLLQANDPSRDQGEIQQAIADLREVGRRYPTSRYARAARDLIAEGENSLAEHEYLVGMFYFKRKRWNAASERFLELLERYGRYPDRDKVLYYLGRTRLEEGENTEGRLYLGQLLDQYPTSKWSEQARELLEKSETAET